MFKLILTLTILGVALADVSFLKRPTEYVRILRQRQEIDPIGSYNWSFETENGISSKEQGRLRTISSGPRPEEALRAEGSFSYTSPEGLPVYVDYVADENGYQPQSNVLPTPPPVPEYILRSLEYQRNHPVQQKQQPFRRF